jgi:hypothetical protein
MGIELSTPFHKYAHVFVSVTPAKAGVQKAFKNWIPAFAGMTNQNLCRDLDT